MFEGTNARLHQCQSEFNAKIQDSFGKSIDGEVFMPLEEGLDSLEFTYKEAEIKIAEITAITAELRMIV